MKSFKFCIVLTLVFFSSLSWAQNGRINGFITDDETGEVLIGANVFLLETGQGMATDRNGYYVLDGISTGGFTVVVSYLGYNEYRGNCLLYTSPSPRDLSTSRMPSSA